MSSESNALAKRMKVGDESALGLLMDLHRGWVYAKAYSFLRNTQDAEDATSELFHKLWTDIDKWRESGADYEGYMRIVAKNFFIDLLRAKKRREKLVDIVELNASVPDLDDSKDFLAVIDNNEADPLQLMLMSEIAQKVEEVLIAHAQQKHRLAFILYEFEGFGYKKIAEILNAQRNTVKVWIYRAKQTLRYHLKEFYDIP